MQATAGRVSALPAARRLHPPAAHPAWCHRLPQPVQLGAAVLRWHLPIHVHPTLGQRVRLVAFSSLSSAGGSSTADVQGGGSRGSMAASGAVGAAAAAAVAAALAQGKTPIVVLYEFCQVWYRARGDAGAWFGRSAIRGSRVKGFGCSGIGTWLITFDQPPRTHVACRAGPACLPARSNAV